MHLNARFGSVNLQVGTGVGVGRVDGVKGEKHLLWGAYVCPFRFIRRDTVEARGREWGGVEMVTTVAPPPPPPHQVCRRDWR